MLGKRLISLAASWSSITHPQRQVTTVRSGARATAKETCADKSSRAFPHASVWSTEGELAVKGPQRIVERPCIPARAGRLRRLPYERGNGNEVGRIPTRKRLPAPGCSQLRHLSRRLRCLRRAYQHPCVQTDGNCRDRTRQIPRNTAGSGAIQVEVRGVEAKDTQSAGSSGKVDFPIPPVAVGQFS